MSELLGDDVEHRGLHPDGKYVALCRESDPLSRAASRAHRLVKEGESILRQSEGVHGAQARSHLLCGDQIELARRSVGVIEIHDLAAARSEETGKEALYGAASSVDEVGSIADRPAEFVLEIGSLARIFARERGEKRREERALRLKRGGLTDGPREGEMRRLLLREIDVLRARDRRQLDSGAEGERRGGQRNVHPREIDREGEILQSLVARAPGDLRAVHAEEPLKADALAEELKDLFAESVLDAVPLLAARCGEKHEEMHFITEVVAVNVLQSDGAEARGELLDGDLALRDAIGGQIDI